MLYEPFLHLKVATSTHELLQIVILVKHTGKLHKSYDYTVTSLASYTIS